MFPIKGVLLDNVGEPGLVGEEEGEVGGEDAVLHVADHLGWSGVREGPALTALYSSGFRFASTLFCSWNVNEDSSQAHSQPAGGC